MKMQQNIAIFLPPVFILALLLVPLCGLPVSVPGIPVWYQDTFFLALVCGGGVSLFTAILYMVGYFRKVRWNVIDGLVCTILLYSMVRLYFQDVIPHTAWVQLIFFGGIYVAGRILFRQLSRASIPWLLTGLLWGGLVQAVYGLGQLYGIWSSHHAAFPVTGSFFNPGPFSGWLACLIPLAIWVLIHQKGAPAIKRISRLSAWVYLFLGGGVLIAAFSRAAWLAAAAGSFIVLFPFIKSWLLSLGKRSAWLLPVTGVVLIGLLSALYFYKKDSADGRLLIWSASMEMISDYPLFGVGWDRFRVMYPRYQAYYFDNGRGSERQAYLAGYTEYPFNEVLGWVSEMGLVGLLLVAFIPILFIRNHSYNYTDRVGTIKAYRQTTHEGNTAALNPQENRKLVELTVSAVITWFVFSLFSYPSEIPALFIIGITAFSALVTFRHSLPVLKVKLNRPVNIAMAMMVLIISGLYSLNWALENYSISKIWTQANANYVLGRYDIANNIYLNELWPELATEGFYLQFAGKSLSVSRKLYQSRYYLERALNYSSDPVVFTTLGQDYTLFSKSEPDKVERAEFLLRMAKYMVPGQYYSRFLLMELYTKTANKQQERKEATAILEMGTKIETEAVHEIREKAREKINAQNSDKFRIISNNKNEE